MGKRIADPARDLGSLQWLLQTEGCLTFADKLRLVRDVPAALIDGARLRRRALRDDRRAAPLERLEPPDTPIIRAATQYLRAHCTPPMVNHSYRTGFRTLCVMHQHMNVSEADTETAWVAALLHDVGLEAPPMAGDFSLGGVRILARIAREVGWSEKRTEEASQAIASNLNFRVNRERLGTIAWAMNIGGLGEVTFGPHRSLMHPARAAELEARYPRAGFRRAALSLIDTEAKRLPCGRFAFLKPAFQLFLRE